MSLMTYNEWINLTGTTLGVQSDSFKAICERMKEKQEAGAMMGDVSTGMDDPVYINELSMLIKAWIRTKPDWKKSDRNKRGGVSLLLKQITIAISSPWEDIPSVDEMKNSLNNFGITLRDMSIRQWKMRLAQCSVALKPSAKATLAGRLILKMGNVKSSVDNLPPEYKPSQSNPSQHGLDKIFYHAGNPQDGGLGIKIFQESLKTIDLQHGAEIISAVPKYIPILGSAYALVDVVSDVKNFGKATIDAVKAQISVPDFRLIRQFKPDLIR